MFLPSLPIQEVTRAAQRELLPAHGFLAVEGTSGLCKGRYRSRGRLEQDLGWNGPLEGSSSGAGRKDDSGVPGGVRAGLCAAVRMLARMTSAGADGVLDVASKFRLRGVPLTESREGAFGCSGG